MKLQREINPQPQEVFETVGEGEGVEPLIMAPHPKMDFDRKKLGVCELCGTEFSPGEPSVWYVVYKYDTLSPRFEWLPPSLKAKQRQEYARGQEFWDNGTRRKSHLSCIAMLTDETEIDESDSIVLSKLAALTKHVELMVNHPWIETRDWKWNKITTEFHLGAIEIFSRPTYEAFITWQNERTVMTGSGDIVLEPSVIVSDEYLQPDSMLMSKWEARWLKQGWC